MPSARRSPGRLLLGAVALLALGGGCGPREDGPDATLAPELAELSSRLESAAREGALGGEEGRALAESLTALFSDAAALCDGCTGVPGVVEDPAGGGLAFAIRGPEAEPLADLHLFYRPDLSPEALPGWGRTTFGGRPAAGFEGEHLFVWAGRFELRVFARSDELRSAEGLERVLGLVPLDVLERL